MINSVCLKRGIDLSEISVNVGIVSIPESRIKKFVCWLPRRLADTNKVEARIDNVRSSLGGIDQHMAAMKEIVNILV
jgi:hypothetical protein